MARRVLGAIAFTEATGHVGRNEAKKNVKLQPTYIDQNRENVSQWVQKRSSILRPFIAWDGEGWTDENGQHHYMLFGNSAGKHVAARSLSTAQCLELMLDTERENPDAYHVWFAGNYDVNMILRDVDLENLYRLKNEGKCVWHGYTIRWMKGKMFQVTKEKVTCRIDDTFTFYAMSFVKAVREYLGDVPELDAIEAGKAKRSNFQLTDFNEIFTYWSQELVLMVRLTERLREYLAKAGIYLHRYHGPGAVASTILRSRKFSRNPMDSAIARAAQFAYSGGRFEQFRIGRHRNRVYQYDIRSAYPYVISTLPDLDGDWQHVVGQCEVRSFSLYRVTYTAPLGHAPHLPHPLFWRHKNGSVFYPAHTSGWYWGCEIVGLNVEIHEAYIYTPSGRTRPFQWIADMYRQRALWKSMGEPAQLALKLAMNSIYGKLAQQIGWRLMADGTVKIPTFHQLEYAGYITAVTRSMIYRAAMQKPWAVIATETDSICLTEPIDLEIGNELGNWEATEFEDIMYLQSGVYWSLSEGEWKTRTRGFGRNVLDPADVDSWLATITDAESAYTVEPLSVSQSRFNTLGQSIGTDRWRTWTVDTRSIRPGTPGGKREHFYPHCPQCPGALNKSLHTMTVAIDMDFSQPSHPYPLKWESNPSEMQLAMMEDDEWIDPDMC